MIENLNKEHWRDVAGYDGMYQVSDLGRVRSRKSGEWRVLKARKIGRGYLGVNLCKDNKIKNVYIHRLVADAFIKNDDETKTIINHINEIKSDNRVSNLEWCDYRYNLTYNDIHHRRTVNRNTPQHYNSKRSKIKDIYRPDLSSKENIKLFKDQGIDCCERTVWLLRKDLGLTRKCTKRS